MKKLLTILLLIALIILTIWLFKKCQKEKEGKNEARTSLPEYKKGELIVVYKNAPSPAAREKIKEKISALVNLSGLTIRQCSSCDNMVELWQADSIETFIHGEIGSTGTGKTKPVGEDTLAIYSLNLTSSLPIDFTPVNEQYVTDEKNRRRLLTPVIDPSGKDTVTVAVIDTGIDTIVFNNHQYLWTNKDNTDCYAGFSHGWNFINNSSNVFDDNPNKHGSIVSHFIIHEISASPKNYIQIMSLKTHDKNGNGDLFSAICAIHYAIKKGANIINASWGFYNYDHVTHPYLDSLITDVLQQKGILFVTAAGNRIPKADSLAKSIYKSKHGYNLSDDSVRIIDINGFYPASLSNPAKNPITVTTTYNSKISSTQNHSSNKVDIGVKADSNSSEGLLFKLPFPANKDYLSGSSFATAIASGKFAAFLPKSTFAPGVNKDAIFNVMRTIHTTYGIPPIVIVNDSLKTNHLIRNGEFILKTP